MPAGTPREIVMTIQRETAKALKAPDLIERLKTGGNEAVGSTPEEFDIAVSGGHREVCEDREGRADSDAGLRHGFRRRRSAQHPAAAQSPGEQYALLCVLDGGVVVRHRERLPRASVTNPSWTRVHRLSVGVPAAGHHRQPHATVLMKFAVPDSS